MQFDAKQFLVANFENPQRLIAILRSQNLALPKLHAVEKWFQRGSIPSAWFPILLLSVEFRREEPPSMVDMMQRGKHGAG